MDRDGMESPFRRFITDSRSDHGDGHVMVWERDLSGHDDNASDDGSEVGLGLMEAFETFNLRAEKRVKDLLDETDAKLFADESDVADPADAPPPGTPSYILMSDQYRQVKPPPFHHWRQRFPYFQVTGKSSFDEVPDEHIQLRAGPPLSASSPAVQTWGNDGEMTVIGKALCLEIDTSDPPQEELILADGEMEEVVEDDRSEPIDINEDNVVEEERSERPPTGSLSCLSPRTSKLEEAVDQLTLEWFQEIVPPLCGSLIERLLRRQQLHLRIARETREEQVRVAHEEAVAAREAELRYQEQQEQERLQHEAAVAQAREEERIREEERQQELLRQQLEEHDEEEIKIRTLAYSHTREWYQPKKKCFAHRGRQLTYLKPVLKLNEQSDQAETESAETTVAEESATARLDVLLPKKPSASRRTMRIRRVSSPYETDIREAKAPTRSPQTSLTTEESRQQSNRPGIELPRIQKPVPDRPPAQKAKAPRKTSAREERPPPALTSRTSTSATIAAPTRVYNISPYRIPPAILLADLKKDAIGRKERQRRKEQNPQQDSLSAGVANVQEF